MEPARKSVGNGGAAVVLRAVVPLKTGAIFGISGRRNTKNLPPLSVT